MLEQLKDSDPCPFCVAGWPVTFCSVRPGTGCESDEDTSPATGSQEAYEAPREAHSDDGIAGEDDDESNRTYRDARSTGRKRAAKLYPIKVGQICDFAWHKRCGGGIEPIVGCTGHPAEHIHHGPDKSTFNNERSNISLVCTSCHNRWHAANDPYYAKERPDNGEPYLPIVPDGKTLFALEDKTRATREEVFANELRFPYRVKDGE